MRHDHGPSPFHGRAPGSDEASRKRSRELRQSLSPPEAYLWKNIKSRQLGGFQFNRQKPLGPYIADFYCHEARLVVEVDGKHHFNQVAYDAARDAWLREHGLEVVRLSATLVWNNLFDVLRHLLGVLERRVREAGTSSGLEDSATSSAGPEEE